MKHWAKKGRADMMIFNDMQSSKDGAELITLPASCTLDENWSFLSQNLQTIIEDHTPTKVLSKRTHLPWMSTALKRLI